MTNYQEIANMDISKSINHHNVLESFKNVSVEERKSYCDQNSFNFDVAILNVTGELNTGTIVRNSTLTGAKNVHILGRRTYDKRGTVGSEHYINVHRIDAMKSDLEIDCSKVEQYFKDNKIVPIYVEHGGKDIFDPFWKDLIKGNKTRFVFVFGNENRGVPEELLNKEGALIMSLSQKGVMRSFNVGVASGICLYQMMQIYGE